MKAKLLALWNQLSGNKTVIGVGILALMTYAQQMGVHLPFSIDQVKTTGHDISLAIGAGVTFVGLFHKAVKGIVVIVEALKKVPSK